MKRLRVLGAAICALLFTSGAQVGERTPYQNELRSLRLEPLSDDRDAYRLVWHAWHRRPGALTLSCHGNSCLAELRYTDGYGTYSQGRLAVTERRIVAPAIARAIMAEVDANDVWSLTPDLPVTDLYSSRHASEDDDAIMICMHSPHYFVEARASGRSILLYRYCQNNYEDGLNAVSPLIRLFDELFPEHMSQVSGFSDLEERDERLREIE